ncbi:MAG: chromate transporter [Evtepia sp.]|jgi:chromate transporter|nr:chromate transporter [Evtepia sp.]
MHQNLDLFLSLAKISASCFGGGYAIVPLLQRDLVEKKGWITSDDLSEIFSIAQCTPGVIAVNAATYVGVRVNGGLGAVCATLGLLTPPLCIVTLVAAFFWPYLSNPWVQHALAGLQACVCALILQSVITLFRSAVLDAPSLILYLAALLLSFFTSISPAFLVIAAGLLGIAICRWRGGKSK